ncbi:MAG: Bug family tripartite tricarboxylate transporter substrate binding protein [Candidatus Binatia bacterium]
MMRGIVSLMSIALFLLMATHLHAQGYPNQAINLVLPYAPGDTGDVAGRAMAEELAKLLKVPIIPVNRPGAGATTGTESAVKAKKDGYTILIAPNAALISSRIMNPETVRYDPFKDLTPLGMATRSPIILAVRGDAEYKSFRELIEYAKKNPGKVRVGTFGVGSGGHFAVEIINSLTGVGLTMVPFKGASPAITALLGGHVEGVAPALGTLMGHLKSGGLRGVVISSKFPEFPDIPTLPQLGYRQNFWGVWWAFFAPAGVSAEVTGVLIPAIEKAAKNPAIAAKLAALGIVQDYLPPDKLVAEIREEHRTVEEIAKKTGIVK